MKLNNFSNIITSSKCSMMFRTIQIKNSHNETFINENDMVIIF